ncbi:MAG: methyltransferase domain-containing protein [Elusimicrobiota bacterium]|mgnify:CR=1 FL=1
MKKNRAGIDKDLLDRLEEFYENRLEPGLKKSYREVEKLLEREIRLKGGSEFLDYDPDSPLSYLSIFLKNKRVAAVVPSSKFLVNRVIKAMDLPRARVVVEYGAAEGVITHRILERLGPEGTLLAVELSADFAKVLQGLRDPRLRARQGDVTRIDEILAAEGVRQADVIVSGIPFSMLNSRQRHELLLKTESALRPGGRFVAYQVTTHLIPLLKEYFRKVETAFEVRNLPPHFVFTAHK